MMNEFLGFSFWQLVILLIGGLSLVKAETKKTGEFHEREKVQNLKVILFQFIIFLAANVSELFHQMACNQ